MESKNHRVLTGAACCVLLIDGFDNPKETPPHRTLQPEAIPSQRTRTPDDKPDVHSKLRSWAKKTEIPFVTRTRRSKTLR